MAILKGQNLMCFCGGKSIAFATNHTLEVSGETTDCSTKDNGGGEWASSEMGLLSWTCSSENLVADKRNGLGYDDLFDMYVAKQPIDLVFGLKSTIADSGEYYEVGEGGWSAKANSGYKGKAFITGITLNAPNGENSTMSVSFTGTGALTKLNTEATVMSLKSPVSATSTKATSAKD